MRDGVGGGEDREEEERKKQPKTPLELSLSLSVFSPPCRRSLSLFSFDHFSNCNVASKKHTHTPFFVVENACSWLGLEEVSLDPLLLLLARHLTLFFTFPLFSPFLQLSLFLFKRFMLSTFARRLSSVPRTPSSFPSSLRAPAFRQQHLRSSLAAMASSASAFVEIEKTKKEKNRQGNRSIDWKPSPLSS